MPTNRRVYAELSAMAVEATPIDEADWGSERQIRAENAFFIAVRPHLSRKAWDGLDAYCMKATTEEMLAEALRLVREVMS